MISAALRPTDAGTREFADLSDFAEQMFASLTRSDQRHWAEIYVRGLLTVPGRKSIRRICELVVGQDADQSLQQFVNQSPWDWAPVRQALAEALVRAQAPEAFVLREVVFPKNGDSSVAVARQYAPSVGRVVNCQRATGVFLAGTAGSAAVNWRLHLPSEWDNPRRRAKCRVPTDMRPGPDWLSALDALDEAITAWELPKVPVIMDLASDQDVEPLVANLTARGLGYLIRVSPGTTLRPTGGPKPIGGRRSPATVGQLAFASARRGGVKVLWEDERTGQLVSSLFTLATVPGAESNRWTTAAPGPRRSRQVLADWPWGPTRPRTVWLTNLGNVGVLELAGLARIWDRSNTDLDELANESGLRHFEGRSFPGWHHHVTLATLAQGYRLLDRISQQPFTGPTPIVGRPDRPRRVGYDWAPRKDLLVRV